MELSKDTWHYRFYKWWLNLKCNLNIYNFPYDKEWDFYNFYDRRDRTIGEKVTFEEASDELKLCIATSGKYKFHNLCLYIKVLFLYAPVRYLWHTPLIKWSIINTVIYSINILILFNVDSIFISDGIWYISTLLIIIAIIISYLILWIEILVPAIYRKINEYKNKPSEESNNFYSSVMKPYFSDIKNKICRKIDFK